MQDDYWSLWVTRGEDWKRHFVLIDPVIESFVSKQKADGRKVDVSPYRWDAPDRSLSFLSAVGNGIWNKIDLLILGPAGMERLRFSCAAWRDEEKGQRSPRWRIWCHSSPELERKWELDLQKDRESLGGAVQDRLFEVHRMVTSWTLERGSEDWKGTGFITEKPAAVP